MQCRFQVQREFPVLPNHNTSVITHSYLNSRHELWTNIIVASVPIHTVKIFYIQNYSLRLMDATTIYNIIQY